MIIDMLNNYFMTMKTSCGQYVPKVKMVCSKIKVENEYCQFNIEIWAHTSDTLKIDLHQKLHFYE